MRAHLSIIPTACAGLLLGGCISIYGDISDLEKKVGVHESGIPENVNADQYAIGFGFGGNSSSGVDFIALGNSNPGIGLLSFDADGSFSSSGQLFPTELSLDTRPPIAGLANGDAASETILVGTRRGDGTGLIALFSPSGLPGDINGLGIDRPPSGLAVGNTAFAPGTINVVAVGEGLVTHIADYQNAPLATQCDLAGVSNVAVADFIAGGDLEVALVVDNRLVMLDSAQALSAGTACPLISDVTPTVISVEIAEVAGDGFADNIAVGDFDGNGAPDIAVSDHNAATVYVIMNPNGTGTATVESVSGASGSIFGTSIAAGDLSGEGGDELVVGILSAAPGGVAGAGAVNLYKHNGTAFAAPVQVAAAEPANGDVFGRSVGVATFENGRNMLLVGGNEKAFVYFRDPLGAPDPRPNQ